jgi:glutamine amidotransferase
LRVAVVDYGMGNLDSVCRAVEECGGNPVLTDRAEEIEKATHVILPGVGSFAAGMCNLRQRALDTILSDRVVGKGVPFLGICLGMQLLATVGCEGGRTSGLGWIRGEVRRLQPNGGGERVPHVGWNEIRPTQPCLLLSDIPPGKDFYFLHSYVLVCEDLQDVIATTAYCGDFPSIVGRGCIFGTQFHPEKSQRFGFQLLKNFLAM